MRSSKDKTKFTIINCNARSLCPKIDSLLDCFSEVDATVGVVTETWLGKETAEAQERFREEGGIGFLSRNRNQAASNGVYYGGVAVLWKEGVCNLTKIYIPNPNDFEVLVMAGSIRGHSRKLVVIAFYLPPGYTKERGEAALEYINDCVVKIKQKYADPFIVMAGDCNQWKVTEALLDFPDLREAPVGPTREDREIDKIYTNVSRSLVESGTTGDGRRQNE